MWNQQKDQQMSLADQFSKCERTQIVLGTTEPISADGSKNKNSPTSLIWLLLAYFLKEIVHFDSHYCELTD